MIRNTLHAIAGAAILVPLTLGPTPTPTAAQLAAPRWDHLRSATDTIEAITIHPPVAAPFQCSEHPLGAEDHVPDALGADCVVVRRDGGPNGNLASLYTGDGTLNWTPAPPRPPRRGKQRILNAMTIRSHQHDPRDPVTVFVVVLMFLAALSTGCGDDATEPNRSQPTSITVRPDTHDFDALKASTQLEATVLDQMGQTMTGLTIGWSSTEPSVASVNGAGLVVAEGNGTTTIVASVNGLRDTASVTVAQAVVDIGVSAASDTLVVGDTLRFEAQATDRNGYGIDSTVFTWSTGDTSVAAVNQQGLVSGVAPGDTDISAEANGLSGHVSLRVIPRVPASLW